MDETGRQIFCQTMNNGAEFSADVHVLCEGFFRTTIVVSLKNESLVTSNKVSLDDIPE